MFDLRESYGFDKDAADKGVKMQVGPDVDKDYVLVRRMPNDEYNKALTDVMKKNAKVLKFLKNKEKELNEKDRELHCEILSKTVVVGWGPSFGDEGVKLKYSAENCCKMLMKYPDFKRECVEFAHDNDNYPLEIDREDIKKP